ncbi:hypothetical protein [Methanobrevibacter sp.]|uniref:hypothetical protein n=1 Tax=Methanobrevibacter sp. TaxID=66852 RepID=UPI003864D9AF
MTEVFVYGFDILLIAFVPWIEEIAFGFHVLKLGDDVCHHFAEFRAEVRMQILEFLYPSLHEDVYGFNLAFEGFVSVSLEIYDAGHFKTL